VVYYLKEESVAQAITLLDGAEIRPGFKMTVEKAEFKMKGDTFVPKKVDKDDTVAPSIAKKKRPNQLKELSWNEHEDAKGLRIVVLKHMFDPNEAKEDSQYYDGLRMEIGQEVEEKVGQIDKLTVFEGNPQGVVAIKFKKPSAAEKCIKLMNGRFFAGRKLEVDYFDGVTNYKVQDSEDLQQKRLKEFGDWLEQGTPDNRHNDTR